MSESKSQSPTRGIQSPTRNGLRGLLSSTLAPTLVMQPGALSCPAWQYTASVTPEQVQGALSASTVQPDGTLIQCDPRGRVCY